MATKSPKPDRGPAKKRDRDGDESRSDSQRPKGRPNGRNERAGKKRSHKKNAPRTGPPRRSTSKSPRAAAAPATRPSRDQLHGLKKPQLMELYRTMVLSREIDDEEIRLKQKNQIFFQINGAGHEALGAATGMALRSGHDWFFPYYRDRALMLQLGLTPVDMLKMGTAAHDEPAGSGRQMPSHWGHPDLNVPNQSSCTGSQVLHAVGCAEAWFKGLEDEALRPKLRKWDEHEIAYVSIGDGTTSEGEVWEAFNSACNLSLPVMFVVEDNGYAISVPVEVNTAGGSISKLVTGFPNLIIKEVDGCDPVATYGCLKETAERMRRERRPALVHAHVIRPYSHSLSDDERSYRPSVERDEEAKRDPLITFPRFLVENKIASEEELAKVREDVATEVRAASDEAVATRQADPSTVLNNVFSPDFDPTDKALIVDPEHADDAKPTTMVDLINACLSDEMERDSRIVVFGEDVADASREDVLEECKGKGGVFKVTAGLQRKFGGDRVYNSPLAEANIVGRAVGMALRGMKPCVEIQFLDYIWPAYHQIRSELANYRWRSDGKDSCPVVIRTASGGYLRGGGVYHSQSAETMFTHVPGLRVVMPSTALDANGLLRTALRGDDPVIFLEHKHLYRQTYNKGAYPGPNFTIPFGHAARVREGSDLSIITYGALVHRSVTAARRLAEEHGIEADIIDLRSLQPYDWDAIRETVSRTNKVLVVHEESRAWGYGAEISARIGEELFDELDAPVRRVASLDCFVAYAPTLEEVILPQPDDVFAAGLELAQY